jgi:hypothetical protein
MVDKELPHRLIEMGYACFAVNAERYQQSTCKKYRDKRSESSPAHRIH